MNDGERFNTITHLIGAVCSFIAVIVLVVLVSLKGDPWKIVSFSIYGATLFFLYLFSTLYHNNTGKCKKVLRILDHNSIYILIAGTYTPFSLVLLRGGWGFTIFGISWGLAVMGIILDVVFRNSKSRKVSLIIYTAMGWLIVIALKPLLSKLVMSGFILLLLGGIFYTVGIIFYVLGRKRPYYHGVWHLFVLTGSVFHYLTILLYLL
ncbi:MAG: hemolysin III [Candidatus Muiribacterium halophilum]|uniref:Hemolysin III n=1 Tax=Muiribacterium halophilum TaxID=2053465 RepID=A0A2N5ZC63_MUIH1|nr:MAG: hemolysin III [Candidatus Muirbacterium halophilum]